MTGFRILIRAFTARRDVMHSMILARLLENDGNEVIVSSIRQFEFAVKFWKPHAIIFNIQGLSEYLKRISPDSVRILVPGEGGEFGKAIEIFSEVINFDQNWAEAWNKRATVFYLIGEFKKSQDDIDKVLAIEARHFGALAGQGLVNIQLKNYEKAILSYEQAKEIHPSMQSPEIMIRQIEELIKQQSI